MDLEIFKEILLDHSQRPRNQGTLAECNAEGEGSHPETGDWVKIELQQVDGKVIEIAFEAKGSAVLTASCSLMTVFAQGKETATIVAGIERFLQFLENPDEPLESLEAMGDLVALSGIRQFPARVKCASLPWRTLQSAL